jgi:SPOR domain
MVESDHRSYRDFETGHGPERPRGQAADDPLAELARLISQSVPMNRSGQSRDRTPPAVEKQDSYGAQDEVLREPIDDRHPALEESRHEEDDGQYNRRADERYDRSVHGDPAPHSPFSSLGREAGLAMRPAAASAVHELADPISGESDEAYREAADWEDASPDVRDSRYQYDEYGNEPHDHSDDHAQGDEYYEDPNTGRRRGFVFIAAVFGLAVLGTGVFAYRAMFGAPMLPTLPPIIKAEGGPNKIIPSHANSRANNSRQPDAGNGAGSGEQLVSREERPVEMQATVNTAPRPVSTVPVFPDPRLPGSPGAVSFPAAPAPATNLASSPQSATMTRGDLPTATASVPPAMGASQRPAAATAQPGPASTPAMPAVSAPKKNHTISSRDSPDAKPTDALSIVPSSSEGPAAAPRPRTAPVELEGTHVLMPVPPNKPSASETASAAPATSGGGYAVQVSSHRTEQEAQSSFRALQAKYPNLLGGREPIIRRADLGAKGIYYRAMVGPFDSADQATDLCTNLKASGGSCLVQKN